MKILIIRFSSIGDIVLCSPVMRCLAKQMPDAELHFATKSKWTFLLQHNPFIKKIHGLEDDWSEFAGQLKKEQFDVVVDLHNNIRSRRLTAALGVKSVFRFHKANFQKWLWVRGLTKKPVENVVMRYLKTISGLGVNYDAAGLDFYYPNPKLNIDLPTNYIAYAVGGTWATKRMPVDKIAELIQKNRSKWVLLGDENDAKQTAVLEKQFPDRVLNLCGKLSLFESAEVLKKSQYVVTHDTGLMHIAAALHKPITCIWGNTVPEFGMGPFYPDNIGFQPSMNAQVEGLKCRPCSKIGYDNCPRKHFRCMHDQDTQKLALGIPIAE